MKKIIALGISALLLISISACGHKDNKTDATEQTNEDMTFGNIEPDAVNENSSEAAGVRAAVSNMLDTFISADFDAIVKILHEEDRDYFNFKSKDQRAFYKQIFPMISYELHGVYEHDGVYGVKATITSPNMTEVYGKLWSDIIDHESSTMPGSEESFRQNNVQKMIEILSSETNPVPNRVEDLFIYVEYKNGNYIPRCDMYLANELIGGAAEASSELVESMQSTRQ